MIGAPIGDIVGSPYEFDDTAIKTTEFPLFSPASTFTDDTVMTVAVAQALLTRPPTDAAAESALIASMRRWAREVPLPKGGYGGRFRHWLFGDAPHPYGSWGNGSAMRVSSVGWLYQDLDSVLHWADVSARVTHNHPEGIKGAQATAAAIFLARQGESKDAIRGYVVDSFGYDLSRTVEQIRPGYHHVESCQETVPEAIIAFLESTDFESAVRLAVSLGGDADTLAAITGSIAEAYYGVPDDIANEAVTRLDASLWAVLKQIETG